VMITSSLATAVDGLVQMKSRGSRQNLEGWLRRKTAPPAPPRPKPTRPPATAATEAASATAATVTCPYRRTYRRQRVVCVEGEPVNNRGLCVPSSYHTHDLAKRQNERVRI
jgi:hypothetical protein